MRSNPASRKVHALESLFRPSVVAIVGATEKAVWTKNILRNFPAYGFDGEVFAVNRNGVDVMGVKGFVSCSAISKQIDTAYIIVPRNAVKAALAEAIKAGAKSAVILTSGFAETGEDGVALQDEIVAMARAGGVRFLGPNSLGFVNISERKPITPLAPHLPLLTGAIGLVSQSGATASELMEIAQRLHIGFSFVAATGNEAMVDLADMIDFLAVHEPTKVIAVYSETIKNPDLFVAACNKAGKAGKPVVMLKVGSSALAAEVAAAHTGALVGDDRIFECVCDRLNIIRVRTIEDLVVTSGFMVKAGNGADAGIAVVSMSGGACAMLTDLAEPLGVSLPALSPRTVAELRNVLPPYAATLNPLDITGAVIAAPDLFRQAIEIVAKDPDVGSIFAISNLVDKDVAEPTSPILHAMGAGFRTTDKPGVLWTQALRPINEFSVAALADAGIENVLTGLEAGLRAIAGSARWTTRRRRIDEIPPPQPRKPGHRPEGERATLDYLASFGVPVVPATLVRSREEAAEAAMRAGAPVVLKIHAADIAHKTQLGGVRLGVQDGPAAASAFDEIMWSVSRALPDARIDGVIVSPMRGPGVELFAGVAVDRQWGKVLAVGLGGIWVELLGDSAVSLLPVSAARVEAMLRSLRGAKLLDGYRGGAKVNVAAAARAMAAIGDAAMALGPALAALEVNPLLAFDGRVEALDAMASWYGPDDPVES